MPQLDLAILTTSAAGIEIAAALAGLPEVRSLTVVTTRVFPKPHGAREKLRRLYRYEGPVALLGMALRRLRHPQRPYIQHDLAELVSRHCPLATHIHCDDLHAAESIERLRALAPDLGIVFGCYRLRPEVFTIPRQGCLNLHLGRAPEFRGSSPGFYEMLEGVPEVGVTVHRVSEGLDAGPILAQETFPLDLAPAEDPVSYLRRYRAEILIPNGIRMMVAAVAQIARGTAEERAQGSAGHPPRRRATYALKRELRRRVRQRRGHHPPSPQRRPPPLEAGVGSGLGSP